MLELSGIELPFRTRVIHALILLAFLLCALLLPSLWLHLKFGIGLDYIFSGWLLVSLCLGAATVQGCRWEAKNAPRRSLSVTEAGISVRCDDAVELIPWKQVQKMLFVTRFRGGHYVRLVLDSGYCPNLSDYERLDELPKYASKFIAPEKIKYSCIDYL